MKRVTFALGALLITSSVAVAQTEVTAGVMRGKEYGVTYMLPKTELEVVVHATKHTYTPGDFCRYADRYLRLTNISAEKQEYWTIDKVETRGVGVPDKENVYFVKLKDKTVAPLMELTEDGVVRSINLPFSVAAVSAKSVQAAGEKQLEETDARRFLTEEMLLASSNAKMAELVAKEIYTIRESRNALLRGEADNMPNDGTQLKLMLDNLELQERVMTEMFAGKNRETSETFIFRFEPKEMKNEVAFRFSKKLGVLSNDDLAGEPYYLSVTNLNLVAAETEADEKKKIEGVAYNVPGRAEVLLTHDNKNLFKGELPVTQFGSKEYLANVLFNKNSTIKVQFDTTTGGVLKVDRE